MQSPVLCKGLRGLKGGVPVNSKKSGMSLVAKQRAAGWIFLAPATIMIAVMSFYPMIRAFIISLQTGAGANMRFADPIFSNYKRIMMDKVFQQSIVNTFLYLIIQVPIMLILAISSITVCLMCPTMSLAATLLFKHAGKEVIAVWLQTTALNFPMAFFWQIFFAGPLVRTIFGMIFKEKEEQVMKEESEFLEGGSVRN